MRQKTEKIRQDLVGVLWQIVSTIQPLSVDNNDDDNNDNGNADNDVLTDKIDKF